MITIKKIAELAGVSAGTVDRVLNNRGRVSPVSSSRIKKIAEELNYQPNKIAKSLSIKRRNFKIAVILNVTGNNFMKSILSGVNMAAQELAAAGFTTQIMPCVDFDANSQLSLIKDASENYDGIILIPINHKLICDEVNELYKKSYPVIYLTSIIESSHFLAYVGCNYNYSGQIACGVLNHMTKGIANVAILISNLHMWSNSKRLASIKDYLQKMYRNINICHILEISNDNIDAYIQSKTLFENNPEIDMVCCSGAVDGGLRAIFEALENNKDLKILTFDFSDTIRQGLLENKIQFTITQNPKEQGYQSMKLMSNYLMDHIPPKNQFIYINTEIMIRESIEDSENSYND